MLDARNTHWSKSTLLGNYVHSFIIPVVNQARLASQRSWWSELKLIHVVKTICSFKHLLLSIKFMMCQESQDTWCSFMSKHISQPVLLNVHVISHPKLVELPKLLFHNKLICALYVNMYVNMFMSVRTYMGFYSKHYCQGSNVRPRMCTVRCTAHCMSKLSRMEIPSTWQSRQNCHPILNRMNAGMLHSRMIEMHIIDHSTCQAV